MYPLSHLIVEDRRRDLLPARPRDPRLRRLPIGVLRGARLVLRRAPRRAAA